MAVALQDKTRLKTHLGERRIFSAVPDNRCEHIFAFLQKRRNVEALEIPMPNVAPRWPATDEFSIDEQLIPMVGGNLDDETGGFFGQINCFSEMKNAELCGRSVGVSEMLGIL